MSRLLPPVILAVLVSVIETAVAAPPRVDGEANAVSVTVEDQTLRASLTDARLTLKSPQGQWTFEPALQQGAGWTHPSHAEGVPRIHRMLDRVAVEITYPVPEQRRFTLKLEAYAGVPVVFVTSRLEVLADPRNQYYFWGTNCSAAHQVSPGDHCFQRLDFGNGKTWDTIPWNRWWFLGSAQSGLAILPTNCGGRAGEAGMRVPECFAAFKDPCAGRFARRPIWRGRRQPRRGGAKTVGGRRDAEDRNRHALDG